MILLFVFASLDMCKINAQVKADIVLIKPVFKNDKNQIEELGVFIEIKNNTDQHLYFENRVIMYPTVQKKKKGQYIDETSWNLVNLFTEGECPIIFEDSLQQNFLKKNLGYSTLDSLVERCKMLNTDSIKFLLLISGAEFLKSYFIQMLFLKPKSKYRYYMSLRGIDLPGKYRVFYNNSDFVANRSYINVLKRQNIVIPQNISGYERFSGSLTTDTLYFKVKGFRWPKIQLRKEPLRE
jgi:hypothetical protein